MENIRELVNNLVAEYKTRSPFKLCNYMNIKIIFIELPDNINGFFVNSSDNNSKSILINKQIHKRDQEKICAHELGHALLHSEINAIAHENDPLFNISEFEAEADLFSYLLLFDETTLL